MALDAGLEQVLGSLSSIWNRLMISLGRNPHHGRSAEDVTVRELMRKIDGGIPQSATFDEVIDKIEHSRDHTYPVVTEAGELMAAIVAGL